MANQEQLAILTQGMEEWNKWREEHPEIMSDLRDVDLSRANLILANLAGADLSGARLMKANLSGATPVGANLTGADMRYANLNSAKLYDAILKGADLSEAKLLGANFRGDGFIIEDTDLREVNLSYADLTGARISEEQLRKAISLKGATMPDGSKHP